MAALSIESRRYAIARLLENATLRLFTNDVDASDPGLTAADFIEPTDAAYRPKSIRPGQWEWIGAAEAEAEVLIDAPSAAEVKGWFLTGGEPAVLIGARRVEPPAAAAAPLWVLVGHVRLGICADLFGDDE